MYLDKTIEEKLELFEEHLLETNRGFNFYVDWRNVAGLDRYSIQLHAMDALIGRRDDFDEKFIELLHTTPSVVTVFPLLFALSKAERESIIGGADRLQVIGTELDSEDLQSYCFARKEFGRMRRSKII